MPLNEENKLYSKIHQPSEFNSGLREVTPGHDLLIEGIVLQGILLID